MSAVTGKPAVELTSPAPTFSYAQAAKGRSSSGPATIQGGKVASGHGTTTKEPSPPTITDLTPLPAVPDPTKIDIETPGGNPTGEGLTNESVPKEQRSDLSRSKATSPSPQREITAQSQVLSSTPSSPSFGAASTSTLPKEDDLSSTPNASSDSTWDKQSQTSHSPEKAGPQGEGDKENEKEKGHSWEKEIAKPASLKPAPPPALNIWQQRREAQEAKAKANLLASPQQTTKAQSMSAGTGPSNISNDKITHQTKPDIKKKGKSSNSQAEEMSTDYTTGANKKKGTDVKDKAREEGIITCPEAKQPFTDKSADDFEAAKKGNSQPGRSPDTLKESQVSLAPPPAEDPTSWPTPETAQDEEKRKAVERGEKGEKEKSPAVRPHGKEKWMPVPYVPSAIFNTPLPTAARRGGRPSRGGREAPSRGGSHAANPSVSGEKWTAGASGPVPSAGVGDTNERGRADLGGAKPSTTPSRPKQRAMSAGAATPREQRKPIEFPALTKRREEPASQASIEATSTFDAKRRTSIAAQTDNASRPRQDSRQTTRGEGGATGTATQAGPERGDRNHSLFGETHAHPRSAGFENRSEGSFRPLEYSRDSGHNIGLRERGEGRPERGRGGFRSSRGGNNSVPNSHQGSGHQFSNGHPSHHQNPPVYPPPKAHSYNERHGQQQGIQYGVPPQQSRGYRSGPRSQSIPNSAVYARFPNGVPNGPQQLPSIQTDLGGMYGYQPMHPGIMSAMPFNPYVEQLSVISMVSMQLLVKLLPNLDVA